METISQEDLNENDLDPAFVQRVSHTDNTEEALGEESTIEHCTNEYFGKNKTSEILKKAERFPCGLSNQSLKTDKALERHGLHLREILKLGKFKHFICEHKDGNKKFTVQRLMREHMVHGHKPLWFFLTTLSYNGAIGLFNRGGTRTSRR